MVTQYVKSDAQSKYLKYSNYSITYRMFFFNLLRSISKENEIIELRSSLKELEENIKK